MTFVTEAIQEADKPWFESFKLKSPFTDIPTSPSKWTVDHERQMFLVSLGGEGMKGSEMPLYYAFICNGMVLKLETTEDAKGSPESGVEVTWHVTKILVPKVLGVDDSQLSAWIKQAFQAQGVRGGLWRERTKAVHVELANFILV
jgi:hypothetical protein